MEEPVYGITGNAAVFPSAMARVAGKDRQAGNGLTQIALLGKELGQVINLQSRRNKMANPRQEERSTQGMEDAARRAGERAAEQTGRLGQTAAEQTTRVGQAAAAAGEEVARASGNLLKQNAETFQNAWRSGLEMATSVMGRSTEQFGRTLGLSGDGVQQATERSARNAQTILYTSTAAAKVMGGMSQEYLQLVRRQVEKNMDHMHELWACRTPHDFVAIQSDMVRETVETVLESSHRIADMSLKVADDAGKQINQNMEEIRRAA
ncbi:phasin family protein [Bradyrhizobium sp. 170]|uniref:phasin family protein n=1 Tax=Bradyrhizobium sp. 170 TaxID=2782641 RepID=UPI0020002019|nr:phasin family protein [Bradyrhizobium sp. 170]